MPVTPQGFLAAHIQRTHPLERRRETVLACAGGCKQLLLADPWWQSWYALPVNSVTCKAAFCDASLLPFAFGSPAQILAVKVQQTFPRSCGLLLLSARIAHHGTSRTWQGELQHAAATASFRKCTDTSESLHNVTKLSTACLAIN